MTPERHARTVAESIREGLREPGGTAGRERVVEPVNGTRDVREQRVRSISHGAYVYTHRCRRARRPVVAGHVDEVAAHVDQTHAAAPVAAAAPPHAGHLARLRPAGRDREALRAVVLGRAVGADQDRAVLDLRVEVRVDGRTARVRVTTGDAHDAEADRSGSSPDWRRARAKSSRKAALSSASQPRATRAAANH